MIFLLACWQPRRFTVETNRNLVSWWIVFMIPATKPHDTFAFCWLIPVSVSANLPLALECPKRNYQPQWNFITPCSQLQPKKKVDWMFARRKNIWLLRWSVICVPTTHRRQQLLETFGMLQSVSFRGIIHRLLAKTCYTTSLRWYVSVTVGLCCSLYLLLPTCKLVSVVEILAC